MDTRPSQDILCPAFKIHSDLISHSFSESDLQSLLYPHPHPRSHSAGTRMTSHIPLALSILGTIANAYPLTSMTQKSGPPPPPPPPAQPPSVAPSAATAPVNVPGPQPSSNSNSSSNANTLGTSPPSTTSVALCEVLQAFDMPSLSRSDIYSSTD